MERMDSPILPQYGGHPVFVTSLSCVFALSFVIWLCFSFGLTIKCIHLTKGNKTSKFCSLVCKKQEALNKNNDLANTKKDLILFC